MKLYRVITENKNYQDIIAYLKEHKLDATIIQANGLWQGGTEKSIVIEITSSGYLDYNPQPIKGFIYWLKKYNKQDVVMLQIIDGEIELF